MEQLDHEGFISALLERRWLPGHSAGWHRAYSRRHSRPPDMALVTTGIIAAVMETAFALSSTLASMTHQVEGDR